MEERNPLLKTEKEILRFWQKEKIFEKSLDQRKGKKKFIFWEGPPGTNAKPGIHHALSRVYKDVICRFKTMAGFFVERKAGWDTHGLPIEIQAERELNFKTKKDILEFGVEKFNQKCQDLVFTYLKDWEEMTERIGFWLDLKHPYITLDNKYIERLWQVIKKIYQKGLLYQGWRISPYCPRCQTVLSSHETALGYKKVKEPAIYLKFELLDKKGILENFKEKTHFLVWTTTPWTLSANVALALNENFDYVLAKKEKENFVLLKERAKIVLGKEVKILKTFKGKQLLNLKYKPPFRNKKISFYQTIGADFVSPEEGTGIVHIAPAFGQEDLEAIKKVFKNRGFPILITVNEEGKIIAPGYEWNNLFVKEADSLIIDFLKEKKILFKEEIYEHDYPFCWRCQTPLLYYPKESWFIEMSRLKKELLKNNEKINWIPEHIKRGRFGQWLREVKDWALSRERFWGTPLPVWKSKEGKEIKIIGSLEELKRNSFYQNTFFLMRHAEAKSNVEDIVVSRETSKEKFPLTERGRKQAKKAAQHLSQEKIDLIFASPLTRTKETAQIIAKELKIPLFFDERLREIETGIFNKKRDGEYQSYFKKREEKIYKRAPQGENWQDLAKRMLSFVEEINKKYQNKKILIVSHQDPLLVLAGKMEGLSWQETLKGKHSLSQIKKFKWSILPFDKNLEINLHRPYIDKIILSDKKGRKMERDQRIADVWFDSGAMPYAQKEWDWQNLKKNDFPADYISEGIDQTRGWFYTLLALSTALGFGPAFKNVICLGLVLDEKGQKMSKSKGNVVDPFYILDKYGADALRWYFFSVNPPQEPKKFSEKKLLVSLNRFLLTYWNVFNFWQTYKPKNLEKKLNKKYLAKIKKPKNPLNLWIVSRLEETKKEVFSLLNKFLPHQASLKIEEFLDDFSRWYLRRARKELQKQRNADWQIFSYILSEFTKICAPFIPFLTEKIWQSLSIDEEKESVHLSDFPKARKELIDKKIIKEMEEIREIASAALSLRRKRQIKVRQPLSLLKIESKKTFSPSLLKILSQEINVKKIQQKKIKKSEKENFLFFEDKKYKIALDPKITFSLKIEGRARELIRQIQILRNELKLKPEENIFLGILPKNEEAKIVLETFKEKIKNETKAKKVVSKKLKNFNLIKEDDDYLLSLKK